MHSMYYIWSLSLCVRAKARVFTTKVVPALQSTAAQPKDFQIHLLLQNLLPPPLSPSSSFSVHYATSPDLLPLLISKDLTGQRLERRGRGRGDDDEKKRKKVNFSVFFLFLRAPYFPESKKSKVFRLLCYAVVEVRGVAFGSWSVG